MPVVFTLVSQGPHHLTYRCNADTTTLAPNTGTIQYSGAGDADVALEDAVVAGLLKKIIEVPVASDAEALRLLADVGLGTGTPDLSNVDGHRARISIQGWNDGTLDDIAWSFNVVNNAGHPEIEVYVQETIANDAAAYLKIEAVGTPMKF